MGATNCNDTAGCNVSPNRQALRDGTNKGISVSTPGATRRMVAVSAAPMTHPNAEKRADAAERSGAALGNRLVAEMLALRDCNQGESMQALRNKLLALRKLDHFDRAAGGFAVALVNVLEVGIANLPKVEDCE